MSFVSRIAAEDQSGIRNLIWKHRDFTVPDGQRHYLCLGAAKETDRNLRSDILGSFQELLPLVPAQGLWRVAMGGVQALIALLRLGMLRPHAPLAPVRVRSPRRSIDAWLAKFFETRICEMAFMGNSGGPGPRPGESVCPPSR